MTPEERQHKQLAYRGVLLRIQRLETAIEVEKKKKFKLERELGG